jgi:hypothetical protein
VLQAIMKVQFSDWPNNALDEVLNINTQWKPSLEMTNIMRKKDRRGGQIH